MKILLVMTLVAAVSCQDALPDPRVLLKDTPRLNMFITCMQGKDTCEPFAEKLKAQLPAVLKNACADCSKVQKNFIRVVSLELIKNQAEEYKAIENYFDKEMKYKKAFDEFLYSDD